MKSKTKKSNKTSVQSEQICDPDFFSKGTVGLLDLVVPDCLNEKEDSLYLGPKRYSRIYALSTIPRTMYIGFFNEIFTLGSVDISSYVANIPDRQVISKITSKLTTMQSNVAIQQKRGNIVDYGTTQAIQDLDELREAIQTNRDRMFYAQILVTIWGKNEQELNDKSDLFEDMCARKSIKVRALTFDQKIGLITSLPYMNIKHTGNLKNIRTGGIACLIPTGNTDLSHKSGVYWGENVFNRSPIFYDNFLQPTITNPHLGVFGMAGAGKSVTLKLIASRGAAKGEWIIILDPEEEYQNMIRQLGGQYLIVKAGEKSGINPLELEVEDDGHGGKTLDIYGKLSEIREMLSMFCEKFRAKPLQGQEITAVEEVVKTLYSDKKITKDPATLYEDINEERDGKFYTGKVKKAMPTLSDLRKGLEKLTWTKELAEMMKIITGEGSLAMFDCQSTVDLNNRIIGIDLKHLTDEFMKFFATVNILSWVWSKFGNWKYKHIKKRCIIDEAWMFAKYERSAAFMEEIARRGRKYKISLVIATQMINEFLKTESGKAVIHQCATKLLMKTDPAISKHVAEFFRLSSRCDSLLSTFSSGRGLLLTENDLVVVQLIPFSFEWDYVKT